MYHRINTCITTFWFHDETNRNWAIKAQRHALRNHIRVICLRSHQTHLAVTAHHPRPLWHKLRTNMQIWNQPWNLEPINCHLDYLGLITWACAYAWFMFICFHRSHCSPASSCIVWYSNNLFSEENSELYIYIYCITFTYVIYIHLSVYIYLYNIYIIIYLCTIYTYIYIYIFIYYIHIGQNMTNASASLAAFLLIIVLNYNTVYYTDYSPSS